MLGSVVTAALLLSGCGGGSSSDSDVVEASQISGVAVDDIIVNGIVTALDAQGNTLATTRTDANGTYTLALEYEGVVTLQVTCDENSTMGEGESCPSEMSLRSIADVEAGENQEVHISPLTEVVVERALALAGDAAPEPEDVESARAQIGLMFQLDPIGDNPVEQEAYTEVVEAIHTLAEESNTTVIDVTDELAEALSDGTASLAEEEVVASLVEAMQEQNITAPIATVDENGTYVVPENPAPVDDIAAAKAFMEELRSQATTVETFANDEQAAMSNALESTVMNLDAMGSTLATVAGLIEEMEDAGQTQASQEESGHTIAVTKESDGKYSYSVDDATWSGSVTISSVLLSEDAEDALFSDGELVLEVSGTTPLDDTSGSEDSQSFTGTIKTSRSGTTTTVSMSGSVSSNGTTYALKALDAVVDYSSVADDEGGTEPQLNYFKLNKVTLQGIIGGYTIDGDLTVNSYVQNASTKDFGGMAYNTGFDVTLYCSTGWIENVDSFTVTYDNKEYAPVHSWGDLDHMDYEFEIPGDLFYDDIDSLVSSTLGHLDLENSVKCIEEEDEGSSINEYTPSYTLHYTWDDEEMYNSGWVPSKVTFSGKVARENASIDGTLVAEWSNAATMDITEESEEELVGSVSFDGKLQMPDRPELLASLHLEDEIKDGVVVNHITGSYSHDTIAVTLEATLDEALEEGTVLFSTQTGMELNMLLSEEEEAGELTKDGKLIGTLEERSEAPVIKYIDGTFESLF